MCFKWRKTKEENLDIELLTKRISEYIAYRIVAEPVPTKPTPKLEPKPQEKEPESVSNSDVRYSSRDSYCRENIDTTLNNYITYSRSSNEILKTIDSNADKSFSMKVLEYVGKKGIKDSDLYKNAHIDRRLYSKIICEPSYRPSKDTCLAICFALNLSISQAEDLLKRAGYALSHSEPRDLIFEYLFINRIYNIIDVNEILFNLNQKPLGRN